MPVEIPIQLNVSSQTFDIALNGVSYSMNAKWNSRSGFWTLDIIDEDQNNLLLGLCLKLGARLLEPFNLDIGDFFMVDDTGKGIEASLSNIGVSTHLVYYTPDEIEVILA